MLIFHELYATATVKLQVGTSLVLKHHRGGIHSTFVYESSPKAWFPSYKSMFIIAFIRYTNSSCAILSIKQCVNTILLFSANEVALGVTTINSKLEVRVLFPSHLLPLQTLQILHLTPKSTPTQNWLKTIFLPNQQGTKRGQKQQIQQQLWSLNTMRYVSNGCGGFSWDFFL